MNRCVIPDAAYREGHDLLAVERFMDNTRHMIEYEIPAFDRLRRCLFLTDDGYAKAVDTEKCGEIKIIIHAAVIEGHILYDKKKRRGRHKR